jgi:hypothetical protein
MNDDWNPCASYDICVEADTGTAFAAMLAAGKRLRAERVAWQAAKAAAAMAENKLRKALLDYEDTKLALDTLIDPDN